MDGQGFGRSRLFTILGVKLGNTPNYLTFVKTTAIAYGQNPEAPGRILPICNSSRFYKRQAIGSTVLEYEFASCYPDMEAAKYTIFVGGRTDVHSGSKDYYSMYNFYPIETGPKT